MLLLLILSLAISVSVTIADNETDIYRGYRLPTTQIPSKYSINLIVGKEVFEGNDSSFTGNVEITFRLTETTNIIKLHSGVTITDLKLNSPDGPIQILNTTVNSTTEIVTVRLSTTLNVATDYIMTIDYTGQLDTVNMVGFYRSYYVNSTGAKRYLVTTQFESTNARKVFPCFDEPHFKATFSLNITYPIGLNAISNTPQNGQPEVVDNEYEKAIFRETPVMSTYLVAFTVSSFTCTPGKNIDVDIPQEVCSSPETAANRALAAEYGTKLMNVLEEYLGVPYRDMLIGKMSQLAIPDFNAGAMENWGMLILFDELTKNYNHVCYRENALLYNENETSNYYKQMVITIIAHEFTHTWFGNLVTLDWWDYTFLNEGFARYFQYFIQTKIPELDIYEMDKQFVILSHQPVFLVDALNTSSSLTSKVTSNTDIDRKFGQISYNKGASVIRMVESLMPETFNKSLQAYLQQNKFSTTVPENLWNVLTNFTPTENLPEHITLSEVMDNWTNKGGFPLVKVTISGTNVTLSQERFLYEGKDDTEWYIPIIYTIFNDGNVSAPARTWLLPGNQSTTIPNVLLNNTGIIVNTEASGYYRVHYDTTSWRSIESVLKKNPRAFDNITRSQIIDDTLNLARAKKISYSDAFTMLDFLRKEKCYYPWYSAIEGFNYILKRLGDESVLGQRVRSMILELMETVKTDITFESVSEDNHMKTLKIQKVLATTCRLGDSYCKSRSKELFSGYKNGTSINKNIRNIVYCNALRYSDNIESDWNFLWRKLEDTSQVNELSNIITSLGCTRNKTYLKFYLQQSMNVSFGMRIQNLPELWAAVYSSSKIGVDAAFEYLTENYETILKYFDGASSLLPSIVDRFTTETQMQKLGDFINRHSSNSSIKTDGENALKAARQNLKWVSSIESNLQEHFNIAPSAAIVSYQIFLPLIILSILSIAIVM